MTFRSASIGRKLSLIVAGTTILALAFASAALLFVDFQRGVGRAREEAQTLADLLAVASAPALSFADPKAAAENLSMLRARPNTAHAALYDLKGNLFASFPDARAPVHPHAPEISVSGNYVEAWRPVVSNGERVGIIWLRLRHERLSQTFAYLGIVALVMIASLVGALVLSRRLQRAITLPIVEVSQVARGIIQGESGALRAVRRTDDEVGDLVDAFNAMLDDLQKRSASLRAANEALRQSESRYQLAVRGSSAGLWDWDIAAGKFFLSPRFRELLGYSAEELPDHPDAVLSVMHESDSRRVHAAIVEHLRDHRPFQLECRLRDGLGRWRWFYMAGTAIWDAAGRAYRMAGSVVEVTERKEAEQVLRDANRAKDEFLATLAHELRNPLAPLRTGLEILQRDKANGPPSQQARATMARQLTHMVRLIDDLLDISRINSGKIQIVPQRIDLLKAIETAVELSRPAISAAGQQFELHLPDHPVYVMGDATRMAQAVGNVLNNASRYTQGGGRICLRLELRDKGVDVSVEDNGAGIPEHMLERIFQLFTQVRTPGETAQGGLGIGLYLVRSLIELQGGTVSAHSLGEGMGSTFTIRLPVISDMPVPDVDHQDCGQKPSLVGLKVLVVDDNVDAAQTLATILELEGCSVCVLHDGEGLLDGARAFRPNVVLLDIGLPKVSGYELARQLRSHTEFAQTLLVAVTGWGSESDRQRTRAAGFDHHLTKPVGLAALMPLLRGLSAL